MKNFKKDFLKLAEVSLRKNSDIFPKKELAEARKRRGKLGNLGYSSKSFLKKN